jgi:hypothetical protein
MAQHTTIYQQAIYYDMVFNRDVSRDVDFLQQAYRLHAGGELSAVLDVACGPGYHARACAQRGLHGASKWNGSSAICAISSSAAP